MKRSKPMRIAALLLLCLAAPLFAEDNDALIEAAGKGDTATVRALIAAGADVNAKDSYGFTALIRAAQSGETDVATVLINAGADVNAANEYGNTALMLSAAGGHTDTNSPMVR